ncbi:hypothetical protein [Arthrobacter sp. UYCu511]|uniref:hypothetical protein n=1 Tax=Arthrobacter sp. UYCu511 TaxID=3156337 RepID=UPI0033950A3F
MSEDIRAAAPRWHTAISGPALGAQDILDKVRANRTSSEDEVADLFETGQEATGRLADLCGTEWVPKY